MLDLGLRGCWDDGVGRLIGGVLTRVRIGVSRVSLCNCSVIRAFLSVIHHLRTILGSLGAGLRVRSFCGVCQVRARYPSNDGSMVEGCVGWEAKWPSLLLWPWSKLLPVLSFSFSLM